MSRNLSIKDGMDNTHCSTCIPDGLTKPNDVAVKWIFPHIQLFPFILHNSIILISLCYGEYEKKSVDWTGHE
jgi:hypothetical protein